MATSEFGKAFAAARKAGDKTFEFKGKKYTTETRDDVVRKRNEAAGRNSTAGEKTATTKAREYTEGLAKQERAEEKRRQAPIDAQNQRDKMANASRAASKADIQRRNQEEMLNNRDFPPDLAAGGKVKKYARGGGIYSAEMGQPPVDIDGGSAPTPRPKNVSKRRPNAAETSKPQGKKDQTARYARGGGIELRGKTKCKIV